MERSTRWIVVVALVVLAALVGALAAVLVTRGGETTTVTTTRTVVTSTSASTTTTRQTSTTAPAGATTVIRQVDPFTGVNLAGANVVHVRVGGPRRVVVTGERDVVPRVTTTVRSGVLVIGGHYSTKGPLRVEVTTPTLSSALLDGSGRLTVEGVRSPRFTAGLGGSGVLRVAGRTGELHAELGGVGALDLARLVAGSATATLSGSGRMTLTAARSLDASLSGAGSIVYGGDPSNVSTRVTGTGTITSR
jgi:hypothetical protein